MATYRLRLDVKPGGKASLDEFSEERWESFEAAQKGARSATAALCKRYPAARPYCYATEWDGTYSPGRPAGGDR